MSKAIEDASDAELIAALAALSPERRAAIIQPFAKVGRPRAARDELGMTKNQRMRAEALRRHRDEGAPLPFATNGTDEKFLSVIRDSEFE